MIEQYTEIEGVLINDTEFKQQIILWQMHVSNLFRNNLRSMFSAKQKNVLEKSVKHSLKLDRLSNLERISFEFYRYGIFLAYGVGRGYIHTSGGVIRGMRNSKSKKARSSKTNGKYKPITGAIKRKPVDWFDNTVGENQDKFADIVANYYGDTFLVNTSTSRIK